MKAEAYEKNYSFEENYWWFRVRNGIVMEMIRAYAVRAVGEPIRILDYGCGTGGMLERMADLGDAWGCDASEMALEYCLSRGLSRLIKISGDLGELGDYDLITMLDVLEHVDEEARLLASLADHLVPGGKLIATVPAYEWLWSGEDYVSEHKRRYVKKQISDLVTSSGFRVLKISYFNTLLLPLIYAHIKLNALFRPESQKHSNLKELPPILNSFFKAVFSLEAPIIRKTNLPTGVSIICVAEKV